MDRAGAKDRIKLYIGPSQVELRKLPLESYDFIYIDGSHSADDVLEDAILAWRLVKEGGLIIFDDYLWQPDGLPDSWRAMDRPKIGIDTFHKFYGKHFEVIHSSGQVILRKHTQQSTKRTW